MGQVTIKLNILDHKVLILKGGWLLNRDDR